MHATTAPRRLGFDASVYVDPATAAKMRESGYRFAIRYVRRDKHVNDKPDKSWPVSLSRQELAELLAAGLGVSIVQFFSGSAPSGTSGARVGEAAAWNCRELGIPAGVTVWCDLEWSNTPPPWRDAYEYAVSWADSVNSAGYKAGMYVGANCGMTAEQLWSLHGVRHYWKAASLVPWVSKRGFQMFQTLELDVHGIRVDQDVVCFDALGDRFKLVSA